MKTLQQILTAEKDSHTICNMAEALKFKNVRLFFEEVQAEKRLNLLVDIGEGGNSNYANYLEAKLIQKLEVDVVVIVSNKITDSFNQKAVFGNSISIEESNDQIKEVAKQSLDSIELTLPEIGKLELERRLQAADRIINPSLKQSRRLPYSLSASKTAVEDPNKLAEEIFSTDNTEIAKAAFLELPKFTQEKFIETYQSIKRRKREDEAQVNTPALTM